MLSPALTGTLRYESLMALRRRSAWLSLTPLCLLALGLGLDSQTVNHYANPVARVASAAMLVTTLGGLGIAMALADCLALQQRVGMAEVIAVTPAGRAARAVGVVLGPWLVAMVPVAAVLGALGARTAIGAGSVTPLIAVAIAVPAVVAPGTLALTAVTNLLGVLLPAPAVRVLVVPLWYWATAYSSLLPGPSITGTVLSPLGAYPAAAWLSATNPIRTGGWLHPPVSTLSALASIASALIVAVVAFLLAHAVARDRR